MSPAYLQRTFARLEDKRQQIISAKKRNSGRPILPKKLFFEKLGFEEKKTVAAQFIRRIELVNDTTEVFWNV